MKQQRYNTIGSFINRLPAPLNQQALNNMDTSIVHKPAFNKTIGGVLKEAFVWSKSKEGGLYWKGISLAFEDNL